jgi:hypothetical protein
VAPSSSSSWGAVERRFPEVLAEAQLDFAAQSHRLDDLAEADFAAHRVTP